MAIVYAENVIEIAVEQTYQGKPCVNVWHMYFSAEGSAKTKTDVVEDFRNNWQDELMGGLDSNLALDRFTWHSLDPSDNEAGVVLPDPAKSVAGLQTGVGLPANVAYLVHKTTSTRPRGRRDGRMYLAGVPAGQVDEAGALAGSWISNYGPSFTAFYNGISDTAWDASGDRYPVVLETTAASRTAGTTPVTIGSRRVTSITLDPVVATQRDRLR